MLSHNLWVLGGLSAFVPAAAAAVLDLPITRNGYNVVQLDIGTPGKKFQFLFDTGSSTAWVTDAACAPEACPNVSGYKRVGYQVKDSSTGKLTGEKASIDYLGGATAGDVVDDVFSVGQTSWVQNFISASQSNWAAAAADGFLGLSFNSISVNHTSTVMHSLVPKLDKPRFAIYYNNSETQEPGQGGLLTLGDSRENEFAQGPLATVPVVQRNGQFDVWRSRFQSLTVKTSGGGVERVDNGLSSTSWRISFDSGDAVFDTGAGSISLDKSKIDKVYWALGWNYTQLLHSERILNCTEFNSTWSVTFELGPDEATSSSVTLTGDQLARPGFANRKDACWPPFEDGNSNGFSLIGTPFLTQFYTVWDFGSHDESKYKPTLSFGNLKR
ncbi:hypothetical protein E4U27_008436 [Claviceps purpurea]|nr:hypothetical protein E4U27_008436 [Claviceps purpurea]KAG6304879.1 hypothetical protein E4U45_001048 [Claviceps purpurea]